MKLRKHYNKNSINLVKSAEKRRNKLSRNPSQNTLRNVTPFGSKNDSRGEKKKDQSSETARKLNKSNKSRKDLHKEASKDNLKTINEVYLAKIPWKNNIKWTEWGEAGFNDLRDLTKHHHNEWKSYQKWQKWDKLLKIEDFENHQDKKCRKKLTLKANK